MEKLGGLIINRERPPQGGCPRGAMIEGLTARNSLA
jgi:hypothetical protein